MNQHRAHQHATTHPGADHANASVPGADHAHASVPGADHAHASVPGAVHAPDHVHTPVPDEVAFTQEFWDERYSSADAIWSGNPNPHLVTVATDLDPATALDVGSGEGADAIWLASRGWQVTGVDVSQVALDRAAGLAVKAAEAARAAGLAADAAAAGASIADRITWQRVDVLSWQPPRARFDLVSAQFMHLPRPALESLHRGLAAAVRPGGTLLIVGHHPSDLETMVGRHHLSDHMFTAEQVASTLDPADWRIVAAAAPERRAVDPDGRQITIHDAVLHAVRQR